MSDRGKRRPNFSGKEEEVLIASVREFEELIVSKHRNANANAKKVMAWSTIARKVSAVGVAMRSKEECRKKFGNLQSTTKAKAAKLAKSTKMTGGGPPSQPLTSMEEQILETLAQESVLGISGGLDTSDVTDVLYEACCSSNASPRHVQSVSATMEQSSSMVEVSPAIANQFEVSTPNERGRNHRVNSDTSNLLDRVGESMDLQRRQTALLEEIRDLLVLLTDK